MPTTVWLITSGQYSDYSVDYVCANKEVAEAVRAKLDQGEDLYQIEEYPIVQSAEELILRVRYFVEVDRMGQEIKRFNHAQYDHRSEVDALDAESGQRSYWEAQGATGSSARGYEVALRVAREALRKPAEETLRREGKL